MGDSYFFERVFQNQRILCDRLKAPKISRLSLLLLSRPISSTSQGDVLEFFGTYWSISAKHVMKGLFATEEEAQHSLDQDDLLDALAAKNESCLDPTLTMSLKANAI